MKFLRFNQFVHPAVVIFCLLLHYISFIESAKILAIFPFPGPSQYIVVQPYLKALAAKGHEVTAINAFPQKTPVKNFRDIYLSEVMEYTGDFFSYASAKMYKYQEILEYGWFYQAVCLDVFKNTEVQRLLKSNDEHFDLVIVETLQTDVLYGFAEHFQAPLIGFSSYGTDPYIDSLVDNISPVACSPLHSGTSTERMNFMQRLENFWHNFLMLTDRIFLHNPLHNRLYKEYFPNATRTLDELRQNFSLILLNQHFSLSYSRPYVANMIEVGGFHIQHTPQPLPQNIEEFIASSDQDVIYFSMGSNIKSEHFPPTIRAIILETFARLPYKILWKFENPSLMEQKPKNVFIQKWFPQGDILAHPRVKLFITHGGLLSLIESMYHGKPVLGIPIFFDQILNAQRAEKYGFGLIFDYFNFNQTNFLETIQELMSNHQYGNKAKEMSVRYRDQPMDPLNKAIYWTEYVLRHHGASFLRSPAQHLNFWQRNSVDTGVVFISAFIMFWVVLLFVTYNLVKCILALVIKKGNKEKTN